MIGLLSALAVLPLLPLRLSAGQLNDLALSTLRDRPYIVVPYDDAIGSTKIEEIRALGVRVRLAFSPLIVSKEEGARLPLGWFEQPVALTFAPERTYRYLALDEPEAFAYAESRARDLARRSSSFDGVILVVQTRSDALFRYSVASRRLAVEKTGLDPIDFEDPAEETGAASTNAAYRLPDAVASALLDSSVAKTRTLAKIVADAFAREGRVVAIEGSSRALPPTLRNRLLLYAPWPDVFSEINPSEVWIRPSVAFPSAVEETARELERLKSTAVIIGEYQRKNLPASAPPQVGGLVERT